MPEYGKYINYFVWWKPPVDILLHHSTQQNCVGQKIIHIWCIFLSTTSLNVSSYQPEFADPIVNLSVPLGRDATFTCLVHHLGGYRVGWVKADTKAIQAIHDHVITHNPRVSVSHNDHTTWNLHIRNVQEEDRGQYMCQINTDPMKSQFSDRTSKSIEIRYVCSFGDCRIGDSFKATANPIRSAFAMTTL
nr:unnamed protein product [Callosobruchus chinensis]